jgi:hypothetical protein
LSDFAQYLVVARKLWFLGDSARDGEHLVISQLGTRYRYILTKTLNTVVCRYRTDLPLTYKLTHLRHTLVSSGLMPAGRSLAVHDMRMCALNLIRQFIQSFRHFPLALFDAAHPTSSGARI